MLELASLGAKVLQTRSVELAMRYNVKLRVLSSFEEQSDDAGTLVCAEEEIMESNVVTGIAYSRDEAKMTLLSVADRPGIAAAIFGPLSRGRRECRHDHPEHLRRRAHRHDLFLPHRSGGARGKGDEGGRGRGRYQLSSTWWPIPTWPRSRPSASACAASRAWPPRCSARSANEGINIKVITTSEIKISVLIDRKYMELAVQALHDAFELDKAG